MHYSSREARAPVLDRLSAALSAPWPVAAIVVAVTLARIGFLMTEAVPPLTPTEAELWVMGRDPHPAWPGPGPLGPWLLGLLNWSCGAEASCLRLLGPLAQGLATWCVYQLGCSLFDRRTGFWCMMVHATLPVVFHDSVHIDAIALLAPPWALALLALGRTMSVEQHLTDWVALGVGIGVGVLIHPVMLVFIPLALLFLLFSETAPRLPWRPGPYVALLTALACAWPDIMWNAAHGWSGYEALLLALQDVTVPQAGIAAALGWQLGLAAVLLGPILALVAGWLTLRLPLEVARRTFRDFRARLLMLFSIPVLAMALAAALAGNDLATLIAPAVPALVVLVTAWLCVRDRMGWVRAMVGVNVLLIALVWRGPGLAQDAGWVVPSWLNAENSGLAWTAVGPWLESVAEAYPDHPLGVAGDDAALLSYHAETRGLHPRVVGSGSDSVGAFSGILVIPAALADAGGDIRARLSVTLPGGERREWAVVKVEQDTP
ncbi:ArnT family glycosyltransferase [Rhodospira trueperi]|uniref:Dolichyl-phosphate-mannose-protein mannosyltransferase n=1 Tax=Rhodospira trueperi TaxID=69960 RepID=A0A1G6XB62_9PROT|nr:glycosyltransferase family 39 protein [Rhodospira trueperi]SDD74525.1 Dolichyl-phosphate-mannose-protein mannosyltransferase [Rhodospira trueperi]